MKNLLSNKYLKAIFIPAILLGLIYSIHYKRRSNLFGKWQERCSTIFNEKVVCKSDWLEITLYPNGDYEQIQYPIKEDGKILISKGSWTVFLSSITVALKKSTTLEANSYSYEDRRTIKFSYKFGHFVARPQLIAVDELALKEVELRSYNSDNHAEIETYGGIKQSFVKIKEVE
jgi:hypothetical protein